MLLRVGLVLGTLIALAVFGFGWLLSGLPDPCDNDVVAVLPSPRGEHRVVVFVRGCGATTSNSTQVSLLERDEPLGSGGGNLLIVDDNRGKAPIARHGGPFVEAQWIDEHTVLLKHHLSARVVKKKDAVGRIRASYRELTDTVISAMRIDEENTSDRRAYEKAGFIDSGLREQGRIGWVQYMARAMG